MLLNYYVVHIYVVASSCLELRSFLACKRLSTLKSSGLLPMTVDLYECKHQLIFCMLLQLLQFSYLQRYMAVQVNLSLNYNQLQKKGGKHARQVFRGFNYVLNNLSNVKTSIQSD